MLDASQNLGLQSFKRGRAMLHLACPPSDLNNRHVKSHQAVPPPTQRKPRSRSGHAKLLRFRDPAHDRPLPTCCLHFDNAQYLPARMNDNKVKLVVANSNILSKQPPTPNSKVPPNSSFTSPPSRPPGRGRIHFGGNREIAINNARLTIAPISS